MKKTIILVVLLFGVKLNAQVEEYNIKTYNLFIETKWKELIKIGEEAQEKNQSSYYVDYRLAVAYYNTANYFDSAIQFDQLMEKYEVKYDEFQEYLYYSYLFSGRQEDANLLAKDFPEHLKEKVRFKDSKFFNYIYTEGGVKMSDKKDKNVTDMTYFNLGLSSRLSPSLSIYQAFSTLSQQYINVDYKQFEYYINANIQIQKGLSLIPAYHYLKTTDQNTLNNIFDNASANVFFIGLKKQWNRFSILPSFSSSTQSIVDDFNSSTKRNQIQYGADFGYTLKPFKDKVWIGFGGFMHSDDIEDKFIWNAKTYVQITPKVYLLAKYNQTGVYNFSEDNASVFVNAISKSKNKFSNTIGVNITPKLNAYFNYQFENLENEDDTIGENNFSFTYNTIILGLKYDF